MVLLKKAITDLVIVNSGLPWSVKKENIFAKCGWSPFEGFTFKSRITHTFVNGQLVYNAFKVKIYVRERLLFDRIDKIDEKYYYFCRFIQVISCKEDAVESLVNL
jgi:hypothetical protein